MCEIWSGTCPLQETVFENDAIKTKVLQRVKFEVEHVRCKKL